MSITNSIALVGVNLQEEIKKDGIYNSMAELLAQSNSLNDARIINEYHDALHSPVLNNTLVAIVSALALQVAMYDNKDQLMDLRNQGTIGILSDMTKNPEEKQKILDFALSELVETESLFLAFTKEHRTIQQSFFRSLMIAFYEFYSEMHQEVDKLSFSSDQLEIIRIALKPDHPLPFI